MPNSIISVRRSRLFSPQLTTTVLLCSLYFIMYLDRVNISLAAKDMMGEFGFNTVQIGLAFSAFSWPYLFGQLAGGWLAKQWGARVALTACGLIVGVATIYTGFISGLVTLVIARLALGCGEGPAFSAATAAMRNWYSTKRFGFIQGITHSASRLGGAIAPPLVAWFIIADGWRAAFYVCGGLSLVWSICWWLFFKDDPHKHPRMTESELSELCPPMAVTQKTKTPFKQLALRMTPVTMVDFCYGWMLWVFISWLPLFFQSVHGLNLKNSALLAGLTMAAGVIGDTV
ncbi:MAG: MFS transporter, partial [Desulfovibrio sp.]|nr:MFS transporter [Desulfovibrio sp.]